MINTLRTKSGILFSIIAIVFTLIISAPIIPINQVHATSTGGLIDTSKLNKQNEAFQRNSGFAADTKVSDIIASVIGIVLSLLAVIFVVLIIVSGYQWMTAGGNEDVVEKSQARIKNAIIGLVITLAAYIITAFVFKNVSFLGGGASLN